jgi:hypothetical protein
MSYVDVTLQLLLVPFLLHGWDSITTVASRGSSGGGCRRGLRLRLCGFVRERSCLGIGVEVRDLRSNVRRIFGCWERATAKTVKRSHITMLLSMVNRV